MVRAGGGWEPGHRTPGFHPCGHRWPQWLEREGWGELGHRTPGFLVQLWVGGGVQWSDQGVAGSQDFT